MEDGGFDGQRGGHQVVQAQRGAEEGQGRKLHGDADSAHGVELQPAQEGPLRLTRLGLMKYSISRPILGGAALQRCDYWLVFSAGFSRCGQTADLKRFLNLHPILSSRYKRMVFFKLKKISIAAIPTSPITPPTSNSR